MPRLPLVAPHTGGTHQFPARCASVVSFHVIVRRPRVWARAATRRCRVVAARDAATRGECGRPNARRRGAHPCVAHVLCDPMPRARSRDNGDDAALRFGCSARLGGSLERCGCGHWWVLRSHSCSLSPSSSSWRALEVRFGSSGVRCALPAPLALARFCGGRWSRRDERRSTATRGGRVGRSRSLSSSSSSSRRDPESFGVARARARVSLALAWFMWGRPYRRSERRGAKCQVENKKRGK